jgi:predicted nucleic acid-binding protein
LPWQVGCEFIAGSRKLSAIGFIEDQAWAQLFKMQLMADVVLLPVPDVWPETRSLQQRFSLSFWDALLVATCLRNGVGTLYTEDMGAPRKLDTLTLINPFIP